MINKAAEIDISGKYRAKSVKSTSKVTTHFSVITKEIIEKSGL